MLSSQMLYNIQFGSIFWGLKFHESIKSAKFVEFKYLKKTNYTVLTIHSPNPVVGNKWGKSQNNS